MAASRELIERTCARFDTLDKDRSTWRSHWQECADYCKPRKRDIDTQETPGGKQHEKIYNSVAEQSLDIFAAGLQSGTMPESAKWLMPTLTNRKAAERPEYRAMLQEVADIFFQALSASNFQPEAHEACVDVGWCGTACVWMEEDAASIFRFSNRPIAEYVLAEGKDGRVDTIIRKLTMKARQAQEDFQNPGEVVRECMKNNEPDKDVVILHAVLPRKDRIPGLKDKRNMPWASLYIEQSKKELVEEGGYQEFPALVWRASKGTTDVYGRSPAMKALADIKTLNTMERTVTRAGEKAVDPPILAPHQGITSPIQGSPNKVIWYQPEMGRNGSGVEPMPGGDPRIGLDLLARKEQAIRSAFFVDVFLMLESMEGQRTATEVLELKQEKLTILGSLLTRQKEFLRALFERGLGILWRMGMLPPQVAELSRQGLDVEFVSPLFLAQRYGEEVGAIDSQFMFASQVAAATQDPSIFDNLDMDEALRIRGRRFNFPAKIERAPEDVAAIRQSRAEAQQAAQQQAAMLNMAEVGNKLGVKANAAA